MPDTAIVDVDGTLVDSNYHHALAWFRAFRRFDIALPVWHLHRAIGMGGDRLVAHVAGKQVEERYGQQLREAWTEEFDALIGEICPFDNARPLLDDIKGRGFRLVLATSGRSSHVEYFLSLIDGKAVADAWVTSEEVAHSKPAPDLVQVALRKVDSSSGVLIGDSTWDCRAAAKLELPTLAVRTGGFSASELTGAGATVVFESLPELRDAIDDTPLRRPSIHAWGETGLGRPE